MPSAPQTKTQQIASFLERHAPLYQGKYCANIETTKGTLRFCYEPQAKQRGYRDDNFHLDFSTENHLLVDVGLDDRLNYVVFAGMEPIKIEDVKEELRVQLEMEHSLTIKKLYRRTLQYDSLEKLLPWVVR